MEHVAGVIHCLIQEVDHCNQVWNSICCTPEITLILLLVVRIDSNEVLFKSVQISMVSQDL